MNKNLKNFLIKYILPTLCIQIIFLIYTYITVGYIAPFGSHRIIIFLGILFLVSMFWAFLYYIQDAFGEFMDETWIGRIVFILVALAIFYLFKITGKI